MAKRSLGRVTILGIEVLSRYDDPQLWHGGEQRAPGKFDEAYMGDIFSLRGERPGDGFGDFTLQGWSLRTHYYI